MNAPSRPSTSLLQAVVLLTLLVVSCPAQEGPRHLGRSGYLVFEAARDSTTGYRRSPGRIPGTTILSWPNGELVLPDSIPVEEFSRTDLGLPVGPEFAGRGRSGDLLWQDGIYPISEELVLSDGMVVCTLQAGELEVRGPMIRYRILSAERGSDRLRAGLAFLAGMALLVLTLLRRSRRQWADKGLVP